MQLSVSHNFLPHTNSTRASQVMDHFGIDFETGRHVIADRLDVPIEPGDVVLLTGASGSGKSSLLRAICAQLEQSATTAAVTLPTTAARIVNIDQLELGDRLLIDALPLSVAESLSLLSKCGLGEAHLMLRTPAELSDGQRYRYRLARALARRPDWIVADEFTATLDRTLAKVIAFNLRRQSDRTGVGLLLATTHEDIANDLAPDVHVHCRLDGRIDVRRNSDADRSVGWTSRSVHLQPGNQLPASMSRSSTRRPPATSVDARIEGLRTDLEVHPTKEGADTSVRPRISFADELTITDGTRADWSAFARWHYRSHSIGYTRCVTLLQHEHEPIGICVFVTPPLSLQARNRYFGRSGRWERTSLRALNRQLIMLARVVLHPTYRGAGIAADFVRQSCRRTGYAWIETLTQMGHINPFFEKAGFLRVGRCGPRRGSRRRHSAIYGGDVSAETHRKSAYSDPLYYVFDNRSAVNEHTNQAAAAARTGPLPSS